MKHRFITYSFVFLAFIINAGNTFSQNKDWKELETKIKIADYDNSNSLISLIDTTALSEVDFARYLLNKSKIQLLNDEHGMAFLTGQRALSSYLALKDNFWSANAYINIYEILSQENDLKIDREYYLNEFIRIADKLKHPELLANKYGRVGTGHLKNDNIPEAISNYRKAIKYAYKTQDTFTASKIQFNLATSFQYTNPPLLDSSLYYYEKTLPIFLEMNHKNFISYNFNNQAFVLEKMGDSDKAAKLREKRDSYKIAGQGHKTVLIYYDTELKRYKSEGDFENALYYSEKKDSLERLIDNQSQLNTIAANEVKYQTSLKDKERLRNLNIAIGLGGGLAAVSIFAFLVYKNTKRKQRIAEQEKELEIQKKEKILKEQELTAIDAMIEGQEKERQRLASDLHDSVGATLSAAKLQFDHLSKNRDKLGQFDELFDKTSSLLDEAYTEVRSMAHLKNSGVIATKGLLPAVEKLAKNASSTHGLTIEVQDFGLTEKLESSMEISIFRIIQELVSNIIKHAEATEAHISITQHEDMLNIIVEDNGKGFNPRKAKKKEGMGLYGIEKRVEHLEGSVEVDTTPGRGTNILIDIPL